MDIDTLRHKINAAIAYSGRSEASIARAVKPTATSAEKAFNARKRDMAFKPGELIRIAEEAGAELDIRFVFPDGTVI